MPAIVGIITDANFTALLADQTATIFLANDGLIQYGTPSGNATSTINTSLAGTGRDISAAGRKLGTWYVNAGDTTAVYIDDHASVVIAFEAADNPEQQVVTIGGPATSTLPTGTASYAGFAVVNSRGTGEATLGQGNTFAMDVNFGTGKVTSFLTVFANDRGTYGTVTTAEVGNFPAVSDINIDASTGTFAGSINFIESQSPDTFDLITDDSSGTIYGQFHGTDAIGVTGLYHNTANTVIGGFAGSKNP